MIDPQALETFRSGLRGKLLLPEDEGYDDARKVWNGMIDRRPAAIVKASGTEDVSASVKFARENGIVITAKCGGHGVGGKAVRDDGLLVDLADMNSVSVDPEARTARVGGGATLGDVDRETQKFGLAVPAGIVSETGVAGLTLGGGIGYQARKSGLTIDNLLEAEIVLADGSVVTASDDSNPDLFWAIRGGGGNFGIVTSFLYRARELGPDVMTSLSYFDIEATKDVLSFYRDFMASAPNECSVYCLFANVPPAPHLPEERHGTPAGVMLACYAGPVEEGRAALAPLSEFGDPFFKAFAPMKFTDLQTAFDAGTPKGTRAYWKGLNVTEIQDGLIDVIAESVQKIPGPVSMVGFESLGGAVAEVDPTATAYAYRNAKFSLGIWAGWNDPAEDEENIAWTRALYEELKGYSSGGVYVNYMDSDEQGRVQSALGENFERLAEIKAKYDPDNVFQGNMAIER